MFVNLKNRYRKWGIFLALCIAGLVLFLSTNLMLTPARAELKFKTSTAPVVLDGRPILKISSTEDYPAIERAKLIQTKLIRYSFDLRFRAS